MSALLANHLSIIRCANAGLDHLPYLETHTRLSRIEDRIAISRSDAQKLRLVRQWTKHFASLICIVEGDNKHGRKKGAAKTAPNGNRRAR